MPEIRASSIAHYAEEENGNPLLLARDADGAWGPAQSVRLTKAELVCAGLRGDALLLDAEAEA